MSRFIRLMLPRVAVILVLLALASVFLVAEPTQAG